MRERANATALSPLQKPRLRPHPVFKRGDHLRVRRFVAKTGWYWHHGIYIGRRKVAHFCGRKKDKVNAFFRITTLRTFENGTMAQVVKHKRSSKVDVVLRRVRRMLAHARRNGQFAKGKYDLFRNNCEHAATHSKIGRRRSRQVTWWKHLGKAAAAILLLLGARRLGVGMYGVA